MTKEFDYISDSDLEQLISQVEQNELVAAPPDLMESILEAVVPVKSVKAKKKEFYAYCFRVITSVAAAVALVFLLPELLGRLEQEGSSTDRYPVFWQQEIPSYEEVVEKVPSREEVVASKAIPSKEEVLNDTGLLDRVLSSGWFNKTNSNK